MPRPPRALTLVATAALILVTAACGAFEPTADETARAATEAALFTGPAGQTIALEMTDIKYSAGVLTAKSGEILEVGLANKGSIDHDVTLKEIPGDRALRVDGKDRATGNGKTAVHAHIKPGSSGTLRLKVPAAGSYEFYCSVAGHKEAGMKGTITVQ